MERPSASSPDARRRMARQKRRDTAPELALRRALHTPGLRYRVDTAPLPGQRRRADVVFSGARVAVYVDGCFWHGCPEHGTAPRANADWWAEKLRRNRERDADTDARLVTAGWLAVRVWEHEDPLVAAARVRDVVLACRPVATSATRPAPRAPQGRAVRPCP
jgi:DNA mismatch endonuclease (patch repair protein)